ncbi:MAG: hypothetical protein JWR34_184 [Mycobacterium sp.]|nr:hypothetical protein [Mycobacterium sp.]
MKVGNLVVDMISFAKALDVSAVAAKGLGAAFMLMDMNPTVLPATALIGVFTTLGLMQGPFATQRDATKSAVDRHKAAEDALRETR